MTTYYVRPDGNDANTGISNTTTGAWKTIKKGTAIIKAGDTLRIQAGTYSESSIGLANSGTSANPIYIIGDNNPILQSSSAYGFYIDTYKQYFTISNIIFKNYTDYAIYFNSNGNIYGINIFNNIFLNCDGAIKGQAVGGVRIYFYNTKIENNIITNGGSSSTLKAVIDMAGIDHSSISYNTISEISQGMGIQWIGDYSEVSYNIITNVLTANGMSSYPAGALGQSSRYSNIRYNTITNCGRGIRFDYYVGDHINISNNTMTDAEIHVYSGSDYLTIENNIIHGSGIRYEGGINSSIRSNTLDNGAYIKITGAPNTYPPTRSMIIQNNIMKNAGYLLLTGYLYDIIVCNNLFQNVSGAFGAVISQGRDVANQSNIIIKNNTFYNNSVDLIRLDFYNTNGYTIKNNIFSNFSAKAVNNSIVNNISVSYNLVYGNTAPWTGATPTNTLTTDPQFTNLTLGSEDFHLKSIYGRYDPITQTWIKDTITSPAISAGDPTSDNSLSLSGGIIEMGAYGNTPEASYNRAIPTCPTPTGNIIITIT